MDSSSNESADILVFSADADISGIGRVFYRETQDPDMLQLASTITTTAAFPQLSLSFTNLFIVTWFYVGYFDGNTDLVGAKYAAWKHNSSLEGAMKLEFVPFCCS